MKNYGASLTQEKSKVHGYRHETWSPELVVVVGRAGYKLEKLRMIHTGPTANSEDSPGSSCHNTLQESLAEVTGSPEPERSEF